MRNMFQTELRLTLLEVSLQDQLFSCPRNYSNLLHREGDHWYSNNFFLWFVWGFLAYNGTTRIAYLAQQVCKLVSIA